jgi:hypothetical protein
MNNSTDIVQSRRTKRTNAKLRAELAAVKAERDAALLRWQRLYGEIDCRVEHGADSNGHLEAIRKRMQKEAKR